MKKIANILVGLVALIHIYILILEMFLWEHKAPGIFGMSNELAMQTKDLAANQGLYNGFLAAGLIWSLMLDEKSKPIQQFFLLCVVIAGIFGAITASPRILFVQALPAALALGFVLSAKKHE